MEGPFHSSEMAGITPRSIKRLFDQIASDDNPNRHFVMHVSMVEIYNGRKEGERRTRWKEDGDDDNDEDEDDDGG